MVYIVIKFQNELLFFVIPNNNIPHFDVASVTYSLGTNLLLHLNEF